jgi:hypothetical protein
MPELRQQEQAVRAELQSLHMAAQDQSRYLRVVDSLKSFSARLQGNAEQLDLTRISHGEWASSKDREKKKWQKAAVFMA